MKKYILLMLTCLMCFITVNCYAFSLDKNQWKQFSTTNNIELYYDSANIKIEGNTANAWICYHYLKSDSYRLIYKKYLKGSNTSTVLKVLDYYSDGTFRRGSTKVIENVSLAANEASVLANFW